METSILKSEYENLKPIKEKTLPEYYLAKAKLYANLGKEYWLVDGLTDEKRLFSKFDQETGQIASSFYKLGLRKGDTVIFMTRDLCKTHILCVGIWRANAILRATYPEDDADTILSRVKESNCKFVVCEEDAIQRCKEVAGKIDWKLEIVTVNRVDSALLSLQQILEEDDGADCPEILVTEDDPALILCTSGTTGLPKGALHTHRSFLYTTRDLERFAFTKTKPNLIATKATHISGSMPLIVMAVGNTSVVVSNLTKDNILNTAAKYKPGYAFAFPTFLIAMAEAHSQGLMDFSSIELVFTAGVALTPAIKQTLKKLPNVKDLIVAFGMTETLLCATSAVMKEIAENEPSSIRELPDFSVGKSFPGAELQFRNPDTMAILGPNQQGEICVKSPSVFHSYFLNPEATKNAFVDGYFRTGDIGYYDPKGFVYIVDRLKEIFKYYNDHISPTELESVIGKHPKVSEVCVVGVADAGGHVPRAFVTLQQNSGVEKDVAEEIREYANGKLAPYKHLRGGVYIVNELPKGKTGKISRQLVQNLPVHES